MNRSHVLPVISHRIAGDRTAGSSGETAIVQVYRLVALLGRQAQQLGRSLHGWRSRRLAIRQLSTLNDRLLADVGIERAQIDAVVDGLWRSNARERSRPSRRAEWLASPSHASRTARNDNRGAGGPAQRSIA
jgi:uncharacterized protein YjiS (DUF1127 family)